MTRWKETGLSITGECTCSCIASNSPGHLTRHRLLPTVLRQGSAQHKSDRAPILHGVWLLHTKSVQSNSPLWKKQGLDLRLCLRMSKWWTWVMLRVRFNKNERATCLLHLLQRRNAGSSAQTRPLTCADSITIAESFQGNQLNFTTQSERFIQMFLHYKIYHVESVIILIRCHDSHHMPSLNRDHSK